MISRTKMWLRAYLKPVVVKWPWLHSVVRRSLAVYRSFRGPLPLEPRQRELVRSQTGATAERTFLPEPLQTELLQQQTGTTAELTFLPEPLQTELLQQRAGATAERTFLLDQLNQCQQTIEQQRADIERLTGARMAGHNVTVIEQDPPSKRLIALITAREDLTSVTVEKLAAAVESFLADPATDRIGIHRDIGKALFQRSPALYSGDGLPDYLRRYTYPPMLSILLSSHCNAACFFCRPSDYKGATIEFENVFKLESAIRYARIVDLTGWGEPFFYPQFEEVVDFVTSLNDTKQLIQITSNGSFLSERWGRLLSGKLSKLVISINAATPETYAEQMRYKSEQFTFERTVANIREFREQLTDEDRKRIDLHMVANTGNFREIVPMVKLASELQAPVVSIGHYICAQEEHVDKTLWNVKEDYNAAIKAGRALGSQLGVAVHGREFFTEEKESKGAENCMAPFEQCFIEMPGTLSPCCFMGAERMGNVYTDGFETVWFSNIMNRLRANRFLPPCQVCTVFTPFDNKIAHMSAFLTTKETELVLGGGPPLGNRVTSSQSKKKSAAIVKNGSN